MENRWISVKKATPNREDDYLCTSNDGYVDIVAFKGGKWDLFDDNVKVIAWQPLPKPYHEETFFEKKISAFGFSRRTNMALMRHGFRNGQDIYQYYLENGDFFKISSIGKKANKEIMNELEKHIESESKE